MKENTKVAIFIGSDSDFSYIEETINILKKFDITFEVIVASAHRSPERVRNYVKEFEKQGVEVIIAAAGSAAALPGSIAAETILPVIGIPLPSSSLAGEDSLFSIAQMPSGVPVATMAIGKAGATNAAVFAAQILALKDKNIQKKLENYKKELADGVAKKSENLRKQLNEKHI